VLVSWQYIYDLWKGHRSKDQASMCGCWVAISERTSPAHPSMAVMRLKSDPPQLGAQRFFLDGRDRRWTAWVQIRLRSGGRHNDPISRVLSVRCKNCLPHLTFQPRRGRLSGDICSNPNQLEELKSMIKTSSNLDVGHLPFPSHHISVAVASYFSCRLSCSIPTTFM